jgi:hypothetical protein
LNRGGGHMRARVYMVVCACRRASKWLCSRARARAYTRVYACARRRGEGRRRRARASKWLCSRARAYMVVRACVDASKWLYARARAYTRVYACARKRGEEKGAGDARVNGCVRVRMRIWLCARAVTRVNGCMRVRARIRVCARARAKGGRAPGIILCPS